MAKISIPEDFPLQALVGQEVTQVCVGLAQIQLHFYSPVAGSEPKRWEPGARVDIEAGCELGMAGADRLLVKGDELARHGGQLCALLGDTVTSLARLERNELLIRFTSGAHVHLFTDPVGFESYHLCIKGEMVHVTKAW